MDVLLNKSKSFECQVSLLFFVIGNKKFSSHMDQISEHITSSNHKIHSYDQIRKSIVHLGINKCENNNNSTFQISCLQNLLLMSIFDTPEKYLSNVDCKSDMIKVRTSSVKSSSTNISCSICAMYNIVHCAPNKLLVLNLYLPGVNTSIFP